MEMRLTCMLPTKLIVKNCDKITLAEPEGG